MRFDKLDSKMREFEHGSDHIVPQQVYIVARLDGRSFTQLARINHLSAQPYDERMRDYMLATAMRLMQCGFRVVYTYTQTDEISLLLHPDETAFGRKARKYISVLAGEASAQFSLLLGERAVFDCRLSELPSIDLVYDYFRWRKADAQRNALNRYCAWLLHRQGKSSSEIAEFMHKLLAPQKQELLLSEGIDFKELPRWHKRGMALFWETYEVPLYSAATDSTSLAQRRRITTDFSLPMRDLTLINMLDELSGGELTALGKGANPAPSLGDEPLEPPLQQAECEG